MKNIIFIFSFLFAAFPTMVFASETYNDAMRAECTAFYKENRDAVKKILKEAEEKAKQADTQKSKNEDALVVKELLKHSLRLANRGAECGPLDDDFYAEQRAMCSGYIYGAPELRNYFDLFGFSYPFCYDLIARGDTNTIFSFMSLYIKGEITPRDYKKAVYYTELYIKYNPDKDDTEFFITPIFRYGGYGVQKDEKKAFEITKRIAEKYKSPTLFCELSLYYRHGIGTPKNEDEANKWLNVFKDKSKGKNDPKECKFADFKHLYDDMSEAFPDHKN